MEEIFNIDLNYYYKVYTTVHEMMNDRDYTPVSKQLDKMEYIHFVLETMNKNIENPFEFLYKLITIFEKEDEKCMVYWSILKNNVKKNDMEYIHKFMKDHNANSVIIITNNKTTPIVNNIIKNLGNSQIFYDHELCFNVPNHKFNPREISILNEEQSQKLLTEYSVNIEKLPVIFNDDILVKWYNANLNDIFRFIRNDGSIYYRVVTNN